MITVFLYIKTTFVFRKGMREKGQASRQEHLTRREWEGEEMTRDDLGVRLAHMHATIGAPEGGDKAIRKEQKHTGKNHNNTMKSNALEKQRKCNLSCSTSFWPWFFHFVFLSSLGRLFPLAFPKFRALATASP